MNNIYKYFVNILTTSRTKPKPFGAWLLLVISAHPSTHRRPALVLVSPAVGTVWRCTRKVRVAANSAVSYLKLQKVHHTTDNSKELEELRSSTHFNQCAVWSPPPLLVCPGVGRSPYRKLSVSALCRGECDNQQTFQYLDPVSPLGEKYLSTLDRDSAQENYTANG